MVLRAWVAVVATVGLVGCVPEKVDNAETSTGTSGTTEVESGADSVPTEVVPNVCEPPLETSSDCCCFSNDLEYAGGPNNNCPAVKLCPPVEIWCGGEGCPVSSSFDPEEFTIDDMASLTCVLDALRDGQVGEVSWTFCTAQNPCGDELTETYFVQEDRRVFVTRESYAGDFHEVEDITEETLMDPQYFVECLQVTGLELAACLHASTTGVVEQVCADGGVVPNNEF